MGWGAALNLCPVLQGHARAQQAFESGFAKCQEAVQLSADSVRKQALLLFPDTNSRTAESLKLILVGVVREEAFSLARRGFEDAAAILTKAHDLKAGHLRADTEKRVDEVREKERHRRLKELAEKEEEVAAAFAAERASLERQRDCANVRAEESELEVHVHAHARFSCSQVRAPRVHRCVPRSRSSRSTRRGRR